MPIMSIIPYGNYDDYGNGNHDKCDDNHNNADHQ